jgi:hypothetical protein
LITSLGVVVVLFGLDLRYLMAGCLAVSLVTDIVALKGHPVFTLVPLLAGLFYRFLHGTLNDAAIALAIPFAFNLIRFITRRLALYDILDLGMVGVIMGWPFGLVNTITAKALHAMIRDTWVVKLLGRKRGEGVYAFPYAVVIAVGAILSYCLFREFPGVDKALRALFQQIRSLAGI